MKRYFSCFLLVFTLFNISHACEDTGKNIKLIKEMFSEFAEKRDIRKIDQYYSPTFMLESNGKQYDYATYKKLEQDIYLTLKKLTVTQYEDIFACGDKVVSRMKIQLIKKDGNQHEFQVYLVAIIKQNKIERIFELTYPIWSDKLVTEKK